MMRVIFLLFFIQFCYCCCFLVPFSYSSTWCNEHFVHAKAMKKVKASSCLSSFSTTWWLSVIFIDVLCHRAAFYVFLNIAVVISKGKGDDVRLVMYIGLRSLESVMKIA